MDPFGYYAAGVQQGLDDAFKQGGDGAQDSSPLAGAAPAPLDAGEGLMSGGPRGAPAPSPDMALGGAGAAAGVAAASAQDEGAAASAAPAAGVTANGGVHGACGAAVEGVPRGQEPAGAAGAGAHMERALAHAAADEARCLPSLCKLLSERLGFGWEL